MRGTEPQGAPRGPGPGTFPMAASTSPELFPRAQAAGTALSSSLRSKGVARWPLSLPSRAPPAPNSREHTRTAPPTSPHLKPISEALLKTAIKSSTSAVPMSELVTKVEATPLIAYTSTTECIRPTSLVITTTYPTACVTLTTAERRPSATTSPPTTTTALGRTPTTVALLSSSVSAPHTTFRTPVSSTTATPERASLATASIQTPRSLTPITTSTLLPLPLPVHSKQRPPPLMTPHPQEYSQFCNTSLFYSSDHQYLDISHEHTSVFSACSIHKIRLQLDHKQTGTMATTEIPTPTNISTIVTLNTASLPTSSTPETTTTIGPAPTTTDTHATSPAAGLPSSTMFTAHTRKTTVTAFHAASTWKATRTPAGDVWTRSLATEIPSRLATTSSVTPMNTVDSLTSTASTPGTVTTKTLTSATRMHLSSLPAPTTESVSTSTANTTPSSTLNTRTSPTTSSLKTFATDTTTGCFLCSPTPCPDSVSVTIAPVSPATPCVETGPSSEVTSTPTNPVSVFTSPTEMATSPSSTSMTTARPMHTDTSTVLETHPAHSITAAPSSVGTGTVPSDTVVTSTQRPTSGNWMSTNSVTIPHMPGFTSLPLTPRPSSSFPTAVVTSSKSTHAAPTTTKTPETPAVTPRSTTTLTSPRTTLTTAQMTTRSRLTTTPGPCDNGGTWMQGLCHCPLGFSGDHCELQEIRCQNGGKWDGFRCHCPSTFYGSCCEFVADQVDLGTVDTEVDMEVSVDQEFSPDLNDSTSTAYKDFSDTFRDQKQKNYQNVQGFKDVETLSLGSGSIVVVYLVLLELPFSLQLESEYEKMKTVLKEELQNVSYNGDSCQNNQTLCFKPDSVKVSNNTRKELTLEAICHRATAKGYEDFYFPLVEENRLCCVTKCTPGVDGAIDCHQGQCLLQRSGPACRCFSTDTHWFSGPRCEVAVAWRALVGGLVGVVVLLLLLLLASLSLFVALSRSRRGGQGGGQSWDDDRRWFEIWDEDTVGTFSNLGLEDDRTVKDEHFQVALENADTNVRVHIQRPEVGLVLTVSPARPPPPCPRQ
ncbi:mucin-3A [Ailuropoda melanoleuca]|uniref:mucin-3A n=1 Tax=Ailuropoda melanoleuca TaxID=9646 RepID=UPI000947B663|nr:mucin-3A [Ailuropoda melanoleuca]